MAQFDINTPPLAYDNSGPLEQAYFKEGVYVVNADNLIMRPDVRKAIFPHLKEDEFFDFFVQTGRTITGQSEFHHHEETPLIPVPQIKSIAGTPGAGNAVTITIEAVNDKTMPFKKWDVWEVGGVEGWIKSDADITADGTDGEHEVVLTPDPAVNIVGAAVVGEFITWRGTAKADGTGQPDGMHNKPVKFTGRTQIMATTYVSNGSAAANMSDVVVTKSGKKFAYYRGVDQAYTRHKMAIALALGLGQGTNAVVDNVDPNADGGTVRRTEGMDWKIQNYGLNNIHSVFDFDELQKINVGLDAQNAPAEYCVIAGNRAYYEAEKIFFDKGIPPTFGAFAGNDYTRWGHASPEEQMLHLGYKGVYLFGRSFYMKKEPFLYYKQITGAPGKPYPDTMYFLPMDKYTSKDPMTGETESMELCQIRYKASDRENRFMQYTVKDWKTDGVDKFYFWHRSEMGWQQAMLHLAVRSTKATASS